MSTQVNRALVARFYEEVLNGGRLEVLDEIVALDFREHGAAPSDQGREGLRSFLRTIGSGLSGVRWESRDWIAEGDRVVVRGSVSGTHTGELFGQPPTGRVVRWTAIHIWVVADGLIQQRWVEVNLLAIMEQLQTPHEAS